MLLRGIAIFVNVKRIGSEQERYAPKTRQGYEGVDNSWKHRAHASANPSYYIKTEYADTTPVERPDNDERQGYSVHNLHILTFLYCYLQ